VVRLTRSCGRFLRLITFSGDVDFVGHRGRFHIGTGRGTVDARCHWMNKGVAVGAVVVNETSSAGNTVVTVQVTGDVDAVTVGEVRGALVSVILRRRPTRIIVDLAAVTAMDSAAVGMFSAAYDVARDMHLVLTLHASSVVVSDQLHYAGIPTCPCPLARVRGARGVAAR
jgi:anti-anti-sigma factor